MLSMLRLCNEELLKLEYYDGDNNDSGGDDDADNNDDDILYTNYQN